MKVKEQQCLKTNQAVPVKLLGLLLTSCTLTLTKASVGGKGVQRVTFLDQVEGTILPGTP